MNIAVYLVAGLVLALVIGIWSYAWKILRRCDGSRVRLTGNETLFPLDGQV